mgnify:CR=1 FL=1
MTMSKMRTKAPQPLTAVKNWCQRTAAAVTMTDLYPSEDWNFVFGQASLRNRVGAYSFARYDPAFYGKERGPGLGLSVSYSIVKEHGGRIELEPRGRGEGALFRIVLPIVDGPMAEATLEEESPVSQPSPLRGRRILVAEISCRKTFRRVTVPEGRPGSQSR